MFEPTRLMKSPSLVRNVFARPRLLFCALSGIAIFFLEPGHYQLATRVLLAWNIATWLYVALALHMMSGATEASMRRHAELGDESRFIVLTLAVLAAMASLAAIIAQLAAVKDAHGLLKGLHLGLAASTIASAWVFIHIIFTQHYAHEYFVERGEEIGQSGAEAGGLSFPSTAEPSFTDFLYFAFVIGVAGQTADVATTSRPMRKIVLIHCILSFFFNTTVLALTINIAAGLI